MKVKQAIPIILTMLCLNGFGQNLVPNWSFEDTVWCPQTPADPLASTYHWFSPTTGTPDLYLPTCGINPDGIWGFQRAATGDTFIGMIVSRWSTFGGVPEPRYQCEYATCQLIDTLYGGYKYCVGFKLSFGNRGNIASSHFGLYLSADTNFYSNDAELLDYPAQLSLDTVFSDTAGWIEISAEIIAEGGERFVTVGVFADSLDLLFETDLLPPNVGHETPYYFVDDVYVNICDTLPEPVVDTAFVNIPNVFTPNGDGLNDRFEVQMNGYESGIATIYNRWGQKIYEFNPVRGHWDGYTQAGVQVSEGVYFYSLSCLAKDAEPFITKGSIQLIR